MRTELLQQMLRLSTVSRLHHFPHEFMQANPRTLDALFNSQLRYVVPMFQRVYSWDEDPQWRTLWEDVTEKAELQLDGIPSNGHYLGALIIEGVRPTSPREVKRFLVIDGQQRLTTLQLLFCALRDVAAAEGWETIRRTAGRYVENGDIDVMERPDEERFKLWPTTQNRETFSAIVLAGSRSEVEKKYPQVWIRRRKRPEPRPRLVEAYLYFENAIRNWIDAAAAGKAKSKEDCAFAVQQALQNDLCVVEISLAEGDDSQEIFYSLNSQGRPLSQSDLLRSLVFMRAEKEKVDRDRLFAEYWGQFETPFWSSETKRGGRTYSRLDLGLRLFLTAKTGALVDARRANEEYRRWISVSPPRYANVQEELKDLTRYAEEYKTFESTDPTTLPSTDLRRILVDLDVSTALPVVIYLKLDSGLSAPERDRCLAMIESFLVRRAFTGEESKEYNKFFAELVRPLIDAPPEDRAKVLAARLLSGVGTTRVWPRDAQLIEAAISKSVGEELRLPALRLMLERLEIAHRNKKAESIEVPAGLQVEHVMPVSWITHWPLRGSRIPPELFHNPFTATGDQAWMGEAIRQRKQRVQSLGNLTLLNKHLNPSVGNLGFAAKREEYRQSVLTMNRHFDNLTEWNEEAIEARSRRFGEMLARIWPLPE